MNLKLLLPAEQELDEAITWYAEQAPGLGDAFLVETLKVFSLIERNPHAWHPLSENTRRCRLSRFPYGVIYILDADDVLIIAISHLHRKPTYWQDRLKADKP